ncbi:ATPase assembly factor ATP10, partial [Pilobolus umbonatus]
VEQATKSYFSDVHEMRQHGGKMYYASTQLMKQEQAGYMPRLEGQDLNRKKVTTTDKLPGKISLMTYAYARFGETHVDTFIKPFLNKFKDEKDVQLIEVNVQENFLKQQLVKAFVPYIRRNIAPERKENYILLMKDISRVRKYLDMTNQYIGYVYLIDQNGRIRWTAHGEATEEEVANMLAMTEYLVQKKNESK